MLTQSSTAGTLIATISADQQKIASLQAVGAEVICFATDGGRVPLKSLWQELGRRNIQQLLLEGGAKLAAAAVKNGLIDRLVVFVAPKIVGGSSGFGIFSGAGCDKMLDAVVLQDVNYQHSGEDLMITGDIAPCLPD